MKNTHRDNSEDKPRQKKTLKNNDHQIHEKINMKKL